MFFICKVTNSATTTITNSATTTTLYDGKFIIKCSSEYWIVTARVEKKTTRL